jgi:hypothetical protein
VVTTRPPSLRGDVSVGGCIRFTRVGFFHKGAAGAVWVSGGDAPFRAPSGSLSIADGEGWGEAAPPASLLVRPKNLPLSTGAVRKGGGDASPCVSPDPQGSCLSFCLTAQQ